MRKLNRNIYIHDEVCEQLSRDRQEVSPRFSMLCRRLGVDEWVRFKPTKGENQGWRRSPLGGGNGCHFYMWWIPAGSKPGKYLNLPEGSIAIRSIRHHDLTDKKLSLGDLDDYWEFQFVEELDDEQLLEQPWTEDQKHFIEARQVCQILIGPPGSGKTLSLWRAVEVALLEASLQFPAPSHVLQTSHTLSRQPQAIHPVTSHHTLYITWSQRLAESAQHYFQIMAPNAVKVYDLTSLFAHCLARDLERLGLSESRKRFLEHIEQMQSHYELKKKALTRPDYYFDLIRAWIIGRAAWSHQRVGNHKQDDEQEKFIQSELESAETLYQALSLDTEQLKGIFPELLAAQQICEQHIPQAQQSYQQIVIDEVQDLTPVEVQAILHIISQWTQETPRLLIAGDEAQVVRPTYFEFAEFNNQLYEQNYHPQTSTLSSNLRSPKVIADCVSRAKRFNRLLHSKYRPADQVNRSATFEADALLGLAIYEQPQQLQDVLYELVRNPNVALIDLYDQDELMAEQLGELDFIKSFLNTAEAVKGLEFPSVCILGAGYLIQNLDQTRAEQDPLAFRLHVNRLRVAMSRATEHLVFLEPIDLVSDELRALIGGDVLRSDWQTYNSELTLENKQEGLLLAFDRLLSELAPTNQSDDEKVQGFLDRAQRLFFDEQNVQKAFQDIKQSLQIIDQSTEMSDDITQALYALSARIILSEALKVEQSRYLKVADLEQSMIHTLLYQSGGEILQSFTYAIMRWADDVAPLHDLQTVYDTLQKEEFKKLSWVTRVLNDRKYDLYQIFIKVAEACQSHLGDIEYNMQILGFELSTCIELGLKVRRVAFDQLITIDWQEAEETWGAVFPEVDEDFFRSAQLHEAKQEWDKAALLFEQVAHVDRAFRNYRKAGLYEDALRLLEGRSIEEIESWDIVGLDLLAVCHKYLDVHPLSLAEKADLLSHGDDQIKAVREALQTAQEDLSDRANLIQDKQTRLDQDWKVLDEREEYLRHMLLKIEARDAESKRRERLSKATPSNLAAVIHSESESSDTVMSMPAFDFSQHEDDFMQRESKLQKKSEELAHKESQLSRWSKQANQRYQELQVQSDSMIRQRARVEQKEKRVNTQLEKLQLQETELNTKAKQIQQQHVIMMTQEAEWEDKQRQLAEQQLRTQQAWDEMTRKEEQLKQYEEELIRHAEWSERRSKELAEQSKELRWLSLELENWYEEYHQKVDALQTGEALPSDDLVAQVKAYKEAAHLPRKKRQTMLMPKLDMPSAFHANHQDTSATEVTIPVLTDLEVDSHISSDPSSNTIVHDHTGLTANLNRSTMEIDDPTEILDEIREQHDEVDEIDSQVESTATHWEIPALDPSILNFIKKSKTPVKTPSDHESSNDD